MFNSSSWQSHSEYQTLLRNSKTKFSSDLRSKYRGMYYTIWHKLSALNLDLAGLAVSKRFSQHTGRPALHQAQILRSFILFAFLLDSTPARLSLTRWVRDVLPFNPIFIALIGSASANDLPPLASYYDFIRRLWMGDSSLYSRNQFLPAGKNGKKPKKQIGPDGKLMEEEDFSDKAHSLVQKILAHQPLTDNPESLLQDIFFLSVVIPSVNNHLINVEHLTVSGDGTAVVSHSSSFGSQPSSVTDPDLRRYSDPDADWGWDSSKKSWYFGRTLYMLCSQCKFGEAKIELPLMMKYTSAKRHDSLNFLYAFDDYLRHSYCMPPENLCLDSAHDNIPTYELLNRHNINALIDINKRSSSIEGLPPDISLDKQARPLCQHGERMVPWGNDPIKDAHKYRCPLICGRIDSCPYAETCSDSSYGRTIYIKNHSNLRFHTRIPRDSEAYKEIYKQRTACERVNNRVLNDYKIQHLKIRGTMRFSFWTMIVCICIYLDAWEKAGLLLEP